MTPEEKAEKLVDKFSSYADYTADDCFNEKQKMIINAKNCALVLANEIVNELSELPRIPYNERREKYWKEVKTEIGKL